MPPSLRVENLWKCYSAGVNGCSARVWALRGCSLHVRAGDRIAIAGRSGSGKTTLLQCIAGLRSTDAGRVESDFRAIAYGAVVPVGNPSVRSGVLYLVDDLTPTTSEAAAHFASFGDRSCAVIIATRHVAQVAPFVQHVFTLREGRLTALPRTPIRRVAEARPLAPSGTRESSIPGIDRE